jgi:hypothetical protein
MKQLTHLPLIQISVSPSKLEQVISAVKHHTFTLEVQILVILTEIGHETFPISFPILHSLYVATFKADFSNIGN